MSDWKLMIGANIGRGGARFRVWAPCARAARVVVYEGPARQTYMLSHAGGGYWSGFVPGAKSGTRYKFRIDDTEYPDPASRSQPGGVHGASEVIDPGEFEWTDGDWPGSAAEHLVIYELHVGTFTPEGTFDGVISRLDHLLELGVSAIEVMPIASFPGKRNWGYDGVGLFAPSACYGGAAGFKRLVNAAHARGLAVILDVVYNHLGPDGNYLPAITGGRFFTDRHQTPWGDAVNFDGPENGPVRNFILQNALYWAHEYHVDGLRLDAAHAIIDDSGSHILGELTAQLHALQPRRLVIAEDDRNERRVLLPRAAGGLGLDAVWADDFHHEVRRLTAGDAEGYFRSYTGTVDDVVATLEKGWFYEGQWSAHHGASRGTSARGLVPSAFVHCIQNHDQVGNRATGDRLNHVVSPAVYRALSALLLLSPYTPLLWMGQEWSASTPFQYFTDHPDALGKLVTCGRRDEFRHFAAFADPAGRARIPDPQQEATFDASRLCWNELTGDAHRGTLELYRQLLAFRAEDAALRFRERDCFRVARLNDGALAMRRGRDADQVLVIVVVGETTVSLGPNREIAQLAQLAQLSQLAPGFRWQLVLTTEDQQFGGHTPQDARARVELGGPISGPVAAVFRAQAAA